MFFSILICQIRYFQTSTFDTRDTFNLDTYYRENVILGPDAFLEIATDYDDFSRAFLRKLWREIVPSISRNDPAPGRPILYAHGASNSTR